MIELFVTLAIMAILATLATPSFVGLIINNRITTQTNELIGSLQLARSEAVRRAQGVTLRSSDNNHNYAQGWTVFTDADLDGDSPGTVTATDGTVLREQNTTAGNVTVRRVTRTVSGGVSTYAEDTSTADRMFVTFNARGANNATGAAFFRVCDLNQPTIPGRIIQVSVVGRVSLDSTTTTCS